MIDELAKIDGLKVASYKSRPFYVHNDHRFILPLVYEAQKNGLLSKPCKLITYDYHDDMHAIGENTISEIVELCKAKKFDEDKFFDIIKNKLDQRDCDWIKAGMEFGMFSDAVLFGVHEIDDEYKNNHEDFITYNDHTGCSHSIFVYQGFPLDCQCFLDDYCLNDKPSVKKLREILGWDNINQQFLLEKEHKGTLLNFDLDAFTMHHDKVYIIPWVTDVWEDEFTNASSNRYAMNGWTSASITKALAERAGIIVFTREPTWCTGWTHKEKGDKNADQIFDDLNHYVFNDEISVENI